MQTQVHQSSSEVPRCIHEILHPPPLFHNTYLNWNVIRFTWFLFITSNLPRNVLLNCWHSFTSFGCKIGDREKNVKCLQSKISFTRKFKVTQIIKILIMCDFSRLITLKFMGWSIASWKLRHTNWSIIQPIKPSLKIID